MSPHPADYLESFRAYLRTTDRVIALLGAGLSASSGVSTYRAVGGHWRHLNIKKIATPWFFAEDPLLAWEFWAERKHEALEAQPNNAHVALAEFAGARRNFLTLNQNIDGLCERAGHPRDQLHMLHGSLLNLKCTSCDFVEVNSRNDYVATVTGSSQYTQPSLEAALPRCPTCMNTVLRPDVVWYGEPLPTNTTNAVESWIDAGPIDLVLVIGTSCPGYAPAEYIGLARDKGARLAVVNVDRADEPPGGLESGDWFFVGDANEIVPRLLEPEGT